MSENNPPRDVERDIDENLRRVYQRRLREELPDRFDDLLRRLRESREDQTPGDEA